MENSIENKENQDPIKKQKKRENDLNGLTINETPNRSLPNLVKELLDRNIHVILTKNGYYVSGFYGLNRNKENGYIFFQETSDPEALVFFDAKNTKHIVRSFRDIVSLNATVWGYYFRIADEFKKPDSEWFPYMIEYGVLNITPPTK